MTTKYLLAIVAILAIALTGVLITLNKNKGKDTGTRDSDHAMMMNHTASDDAMREHCKMMPEMRGCEPYRESGASAAKRTVNRSVVGLPDAVAQETVTLANKDTYTITASFVKKTVAGRTIRMLAYNGQIPGPLLKVPQGGTVTINFKNNLDEPTTIHWHGVRVENKNDGVPGTTQKAVEPGETFTYTLRFDDPGFYWYHPHTREDYEQNLGLYGLIWVEPSDTTALGNVNQTAFLSLNDLLFQGGDVYPHEKDTINHTLMGRFGNTLLVNGQTDFKLTARQGDIVRLNVVNTAATRVFRLAIPGASMKVIGGDNGWYEKEFLADTVTISPSERAIIDVRFPKAGTFNLNNATPVGTTKLATIEVSAQKTAADYNKDFATLHTHPVPDNAAELIKKYGNAPVDKELIMGVELTGMMNMSGMNHGMHGASDDGIEWEDTMAMMNAGSTNENVKWFLKDAATGAANMDINYTFKQGDHIKIRLFNDPHSPHPMQHPVHFHGNRFLVLSVNGIKTTNPVWKDTVLVPSGATVDILLEASNPGTWMAHCHISEHLLSGMMIGYTIK